MRSADSGGSGPVRVTSASAVFALHVLGRYKQALLISAEMHDRRHVPMPERRRRPGIPQESGASLFIFERRLFDHAQNDRALQINIPRFVRDPQSSPPQFPRGPVLMPADGIVVE